MAPEALDIPLDAPTVIPTLERTHVNLRVQPDDDPSLAYSLAVPKDWPLAREFGPVPGVPFEARGLGFVAGGARRDAPVIAVTMTPVLFEVPVDAWVTGTLRANGWGVVEARWVPGPYGPFFDVTAVRVDDGIELVQRASARNDGPRIFCVNTMCGRAMWDEFKESFWVAHAMFELLGGSGQMQIEPWQGAQADHPRFEVAYPASWKAEKTKVTGRAASAIDLRLVDGRGEVLLAYLQVKVRREEPGPSQTIEDLEAAALDALHRSGVRVETPLRELAVTEDPRAGAVSGWIGGRIGEGELGSANVAVRLGFVRQGDAIGSLSLISPRMEADPLSALRATRAFEIVRDSLEIAPRADNAQGEP